MNFNPPADASVITAEQLDAMAQEQFGEPLPGDPSTTNEKIDIQLKGPILIKGDIAGKSIEVVGGLWIDGRVVNCDINVEIPRI